MRLVFAGTPQVAIPSLAALLDSSHEVVAVVTRPDAPTGRGRRLEPSPVKAYASDHGLRVLTPPRAGDGEFLTELAALAPDVCPIVAYGSLLTKRALAVPRLGWVNLHFSVLPAWRGAAPVQRAIIAGDDITGAATFLVEHALDTGPLYGTLTEPIRPTDTAGDLLERLAVAGAGLLRATMDAIADGTAAPVPQSLDGVSYAHKLVPADARIVWARPAHLIDRLIRGCTPDPGAWTTFRGQRLGLGPLALPGPGGPEAGPPDGLAPGELHVTKRAVHVGTAGMPVRLGEVVALGKRPMPAADWARGVRIEPGERLGDE